MIRPSYIIISLLLFFAISMVSCDNNTKGCTDPNSPNYNPNAEVNDGSCDYPSQTKNTICFFFSDTENNTCGTFGLNLLDQVEATNPSNNYFITVHPNATDTLFTPAGIDIATALNVAGFPDFGVGNQSSLLTQSAILTALTMESAESSEGAVNANFSTTSDSIIVNIYGKFFISDNSNYFTTAYIVEDNILSPQLGVAGNYNHQHILRGSTASNGIGAQVNILPVNENTSFKIRQGIFRKPEWDLGNIRIIAVLWKQIGSGFEYINAGE
jgi:hypothetical protein